MNINELATNKHQFRFAAKYKQEVEIKTDPTNRRNWGHLGKVEKKRIFGCRPKPLLS